MPTILRRDGYRFFFYSREGKEPSHIHVIGHEGEMKVWLESMNVANVYRLSLSKQKKVLEIIQENKKLFQDTWRKFHG